MYKEVMFFSFSVIEFQMIGPKYQIEFDPFSTVLICGITKSDIERRQQPLLFLVNNSPKIV